MLTALRSFRTPEVGNLIMQDKSEAGLAFRVEHEKNGETEIRLLLRNTGKEVSVDGARIEKLGDYLGDFPAVVFSSQDLQLLRGAPGGRRRWLDMTLASADRLYLRHLQTYHRALSERNALLKTGILGREMEAFERVLAPAAVEIIGRRRSALALLGNLLTETYAKIADQPEAVSFEYLPDCAEATEDVLVKLWSETRERDLRTKSTSKGPHRDDFLFLLKGGAAKDFASEGQQRLLVIALHLAQMAWFERQSGIKPLLLADDVVGELDPVRRGRFWSALSSDTQVLATGTELGAGRGEDWEVFEVKNGSFTPC